MRTDCDVLGLDQKVKLELGREGFMQTKIEKKS